jgi:hypothetical protein
MPLDQLAGELIGEYPGLDILVARNHVQKAWQDICDEGLWSWLVAEAPLAVPQVISAGSVTTTLGVPTVVGDTGASAAWLAVALANPPLASSNLGQGRQFRVGKAGPVYNIVAYDGVSTITLDRIYAEASIAGQTYQIYRSYYAPPSTDFLRYMSITNIGFAYSITGKFLSFNQEQLNRMDPQRGSQGDAYILSSYKANPTTGAPVHELWPAPTNANPYVAIYQRRGGASNPLTPTGAAVPVDIPGTLSTSLFMARAKYWTADWAMKNINRHPDLKGVPWLQVRQAEDKQYQQEMIKARRQDMEIFKNTWIIPKGTYLGFPVDAAFIQSHDVSIMYSGMGWD